MASGQLGNLLPESPSGGIDKDTKVSGILDINEEPMAVVKEKKESNTLSNNVGTPFAADQYPNIREKEESDRELEDGMDSEDKDAFYLPEHFLYSNEGLDASSASAQTMHTQINSDSDNEEDSMDNESRDEFYTLEHFRNSNGGFDVASASAQTMYTQMNSSPGRLFSCSVCSLSFQYKRDFTRHIREHTDEKPFKCSQCGDGFVRECHLNWHMKTHSGEESYRCKVCKKCFARKQYLQQHMLLHSDITERPYQCHLCENGYVKKSHLDRHIKAHLNIHDFHCSICGQTFIEKRRLVSHMDRLHSGKRPFPCPVCKQEFRKQYILDKHMLKHPDSSTETLGSHSLFSGTLSHNNSPGVINNDRESANSDIFKNSDAINNEEVCKTIGNLETDIMAKEQLTLHDEACKSTVKDSLESPTDEEPSTFYLGDNPFSCSVCKKLFVKKQYLQQHMLLHSDKTERPYQCHLCENGYVKKSHLDRHLISHTKVKNCFCTFCGKGFIDEKCLARHMKRIHDIKMPSQSSVYRQEFTKDHIIQTHMLPHTNSSTEVSESHSLFGNMHSQNDL